MLMQSSNWLLTFSLGAATLAACLGGHTPCRAAEPQKKVFIIGVDGVQPQALARAATPNLNRLKSNGAFSDRAVTDPITHSAACWSSMFTGVWGDKHGVQDPGNSIAGNKFNIYPSLFRRLEQHNTNFSTIGFARWSPLTNIMVGADQLTAFGSDSAATTATCQKLTNANPDVLYMILLDVDSEGHSSGWGSANYVRAIETADGRIGQMIGALTNRSTYADEDWLVIVLSDHGNHDGSIPDTRLTFHVLSGPSVQRGFMWPTPSIVDVFPTVFAHLGVPTNPAWNLDGRIEALLDLRPTYGTNLIFNGDAEWNSGTNAYAPNRGIAWWSDYSSLTLGIYGANLNFPTATSPGPAERGRNFFLAGTNSLPTITQTIDLSAMAAEVNEAAVDFTLSGWFGGATNRNSYAFLTARFLDQTNGLLGTSIAGPVMAAARTNTTGLLEQSAAGPLPAGTRLVEFVLAANGTAPANDASADNLSFVLSLRPDPPVRILSFGFANSAWQAGFQSRSNRFYHLDCSTNLVDWTSLTESPGNGDYLVLTDPAPPQGQAFYRVYCRRP